MLWLLLDSEALEQAFQERYHRPPPWFDIPSAEVLEDLAWRLSPRVGLNPPTTNLGKALGAAWERMPGRKRSDQGLYRGYTESLSSAVPRFQVPRNGLVILGHPMQPYARLRMRDLIEFEDLLWHDCCDVLDENANWLLIGEHDWPAYFWKFTNAP